MRQGVSQKTQTLTDLADRASQGDTKALQALIAHPKFQERAHQTCQSIIRHHPGLPYRSAKDLAQDLSIRVIEQIRSFDAALSQVQTWIGRLALNIHYTELRRQQTEAKALRECTWIEPKSHRLDSYSATRLKEAWSKLSSRQQRLLKLHSAGHTAAEIGPAVHLTPKQVYRALERAQRELQKHLGIQQ
jgi:RNA polymerase sigma factor (sigma-70 family)